MKIIDPTLVSTIRYEDDPDNYDQRLYSLGKDHDEFVIVNHIFDKNILQFIETRISSQSVIVWKNGNIWLAKKFKKGWNPDRGWKIIEQELPKTGILMKNFDLPNFFNSDKFFNFIQTLNLDPKFEYVWYLNQKYYNKDKVWVYRYRLNGLILPEKDMGFIDPDEDLTLTWTVNPKLPSTIEFLNDPRTDHSIDIWKLEHDLKYERIWYLDPKYCKTDKIWVMKSKINFEKSLPTKDMGVLTPNLPHLLDVFFISYDEPNAEENWQRLKEIAPHANRIHGIKGILEAHKQAALQSFTDMFYVVDGDAWIVDEFDFKFNPGIFDRDCTFIWHSHNPITKINYGNGGVKLLAKQIVLDCDLHSLDYSTNFSKKIKVIDRISNHNHFASDEFHAWKGAFRETVKLLTNHKTKENKERLDGWKNIQGSDIVSYWAKKGYLDAVDFFQVNKELTIINDFDWLQEFYQMKYEQKT